MSEQSEKLRLRAAAARRENRLDDAKQDLIEAVALGREGHEEVLIGHCFLLRRARAFPPGALAPAELLGGPRHF